MGKNQDARKRKVSSRNGSSGRGNGADTAKLNGKSKHKTIDETPGWQKTFGALVVIAAVLAAAFFTGVIKIDRNIADTDEVQDPTQEAHSTVADIKESKYNKTTSKFTETEPNVSQASQASQESLTESELKDKQDRDEATEESAKDAKVEDKAAKVESKTNPKEHAAPPQRSQESNADVPAEANATKKTKDKLDIPEAAVHEGKTVKENDGPKEDKAKAQPQEHSSKDKKKTGKEGIARPPPPAQETIQLEEKRTGQEQAAPPQRSQESNADVPAEANATKKTKDKLDIPEETIHEEKTVKEKDGPKEDKVKAQPQEHSSKDKKKTGKEGIARPPPPAQETIQLEEKRTVQEQGAPPQRSQESNADADKKKTDKVEKSLEDGQKEVLKKGREETAEPVPTQGAGDTEGGAKLSSGKEATVTETDSPKGKMVTPKRTPKNDEKLKEPKSKQPPVKDDDKDPGDSSKHKQTQGDGTVEVLSRQEDKKVVKTEANRPTQEQVAEKPEDHAETKPKEPSEEKDKKVVKTQANPPPQEQVAGKPEDHAETKPKEPSEEKNKKVVKTQANPPPKEQGGGKIEDRAETKPIKESLPKPPMSKDGPSKKVVQDPKDNSPQPPSIDTTKDSPKKTKSKVDPELPPSSPPSSPQSSHSKDDDVAKVVNDADDGSGGRDEAAADHVGDASKTKEQSSSKTESKKPVSKKSVLDTLLDEAEGLIRKNKKDQALYKYEDIIKRFPDSAKVFMAKAKLLDGLAEERRSNDLLDGAILSYRQAADAPNCPRDIHRAALARMADRLSFFGKSSKSIQVYQELVKEHPDDNESMKNLAVQYLIVGKNNRAKHYFEQMLESNPTDGFAQVHLGFILKAETNYLEAIPLLRAGIDSGAKETNEGKYFFHLGESYLRIGQVEESYKVYDEAVARGHFRSRYQRSLYNVDSLRGKEFWTPKGARYAEAAKKLESNWETIRDEALALLSSDGLFQNEEEKLQDTGDWKQFTLYAKGNKNQANCQQAPRTCEIIDTIPESRGCRRGQVKFSVMHPGTHVWPHCGPTNCRLRGHLGLVIPQPVRLRVGNITRTWEEGKFFIFDDSFEHEVWQEADRLRLILIVDLWHPDLTEGDRNKLTAI